MTIRIILIVVSVIIFIMSSYGFYKVYYKYETDTSPYKDHMEYCGMMFLYMLVCAIAAGAIFLFALDIYCIVHG